MIDETPASTVEIAEGGLRSTTSYTDLGLRMWAVEIATNLGDCDISAAKAIYKFLARNTTADELLTQDNVTSLVSRLREAGYDIENKGDEDE